MFPLLINISKSFDWWGQPLAPDIRLYLQVIEDLFPNSLIPLLQAIYKKVDSDYSGTIDAHEMQNALREAGECTA